MVKIMSIKHLAQCLQHSTCSINVNYYYYWVVGRMDEELHQRLKGGLGKIAGSGVWSFLVLLSLSLPFWKAN